MQIKRIPAGRGKKWLLEGSDLFAHSVISFLLFGLLIQLLTLLIAVPFIGVLVVLVLPTLVAGALDVSRQLDSGKPVHLGSFFALFSDPAARRPLLTLGFFNLLIGVLASLVLASSLAALSESGLLELMQSGNVETLANINLSPLFSLIVELTLVLSLVSALNFFAVPLVAFQQTAPLQAMLTSIRACLVNWAPMLVYGLVVSVLFAVVALILMLFATLAMIVLGNNTMASQIMTLLIIPVLISMQMILLCAQYLAYRDIFGAKPPPSASGQLLA